MTTNRCENCGRRLKFQSGQWLLTWGVLAPRFATCRSCGHENRSIMERAGITLEMLQEAGLADPPSALPACDVCDMEYLVSRDFTKVFCMGCGRQHDRYDVEDEIGAAIAPGLAGVIPIPEDTNKAAAKLSDLLLRHDVDFGSILFAAPLDPIPEWTVIQHLKNTPDRERYAALFEDYVAEYVHMTKEDDVYVREVSMAELFPDESPEVEIPFDVTFIKRKEATRFWQVLEWLRAIHLCNGEPFQEEVFGSRARELNAAKAAAPAPSEADVISQLERLASLHERGLLDDDEYKSAKASVLRSAESN